MAHCTDAKSARPHGSSVTCHMRTPCQSPPKTEQGMRRSASWVWGKRGSLGFFKARLFLVVPILKSARGRARARVIHHTPCIIHHTPHTMHHRHHAPYTHYAPAIYIAIYIPTIHHTPYVDTVGGSPRLIHTICRTTRCVSLDTA
jgi:hypothetical protein